MRTIAEELRKQFKEENPREELFTTFHVRWLEDKVIAFQQQEIKPGPGVEAILKQFGEFMWNCSDVDNDYDLAIGYDEDGNANSVSLEIHGRTHSEFKLTQKQ